jgi:3',5'-cyclic-AMP phosphodiesterase
MKRFAWFTDVHLNFLDQTVGLLEFYHKIHELNPNFLLICGDIAEGDTVHKYLEDLGREFDELPIFFVLGNHDFYSKSFKQVSQNIKKVCDEFNNLNWLNHSEVVELSKSSALIGHDGWYDGAFGNYSTSHVTLADFDLIPEFKNLNKVNRLDLMKKLASDATQEIKRKLKMALESYNHIIIGTHVPPFRESCYYDGKISNDDYLPFFTCKMLGDMLLEVMKNYRNSSKQVTVLCGHSHSGSIYKPLENLEVICGEAKYGAIIKQRLIRI